MEEAVRHSLYCLGGDMLDSGAGKVLDELRGRLGLHGVTVAAKYHSVADVYPHNPVRRLAVIPPGFYYQPDMSRYRGDEIRPVISPLAAGRDVLEETCSEAAKRDVEVAAWLVLLHHDEAGQGAVGLQVNCFGDEVAGALCPSHPDVRAFAHKVVGEVAEYPLAAVRLESLHFHGIMHGYHHQRLLEPYDSGVTFLLGLCFCAWCQSSAGDQGVDAERVGAVARSSLEAMFSGQFEPEEGLSSERLSGLGDGEMARYLRVRQGTVTALARELARAVADQGVRLSVIEQSIANGAYATGQLVAGTDMAELEYGVDAATLREAGVNTEVTGYLKEPGDLKTALGPRRDAVDDGALAVVLRPGAPDCATAKELRAKVEIAKAAGASEVNFYAYGLYRWPVLDRVKSVLG